MGRCYALPTKDERLRTRSLDDITQDTLDFVAFAGDHPELDFQVTRVACGLAGYRDEQIAPLFADAPSNCYFDRAWEPWLPGRNFWN